MVVEACLGDRGVVAGERLDQLPGAHVKQPCGLVVPSCRHVCLSTVHVNTVHIALVPTKRLHGGGVAVRHIPDLDGRVARRGGNERGRWRRRDVPDARCVPPQRQNHIAAVRVPQPHRVIAGAGGDDVCVCADERNTLDVLTVAAQDVALGIGQHRALVLLQQGVYVWAGLGVVSRELDLVRDRLLQERDQAIRRHAHRAVSVLGGVELEHGLELLHQLLPGVLDAVPGLK
mmetsp:Transcript_25821/g.44493  ORF Transcript_25821/g.44493 Transcript_25821/m.44493 type:complete len:231 (+) Transcript_25821:708-1400(+)